MSGFRDVDLSRQSADRVFASGATAMKIPGGLLGSPAAYAGLAVGVALFAGIILWQGVSDVAEALVSAGWGIIAIVLLHLPPLWADAMGWRSLLPAGRRCPVRMFVWARWIGESINDLLPVLQMGGNVVKAWLLHRRGVEVGLAGASVVVDVTLVVLSQILFTLIGLVLLMPHLGGGPRLVVLAGAAIFMVLLGGFYAAQRGGFFGFLVRASKRILGGPGWTSAADGAAAIDSAVLRLYKQRRALLASGSWHILSWFLGIGEIWFALRLLGHPVSLPTALLFESLGQAIRTGAFAVPGALGVQEGGYVLVGAVLGIDAPIALALSLARRVRELFLGVPGLAAWQASSLRRVLRAEKSSAAASPPAAPVQRESGNPGGPDRWKVKRAPVVRAINALGRALGAAGIRVGDLAEEGLIRAACRATGLHDFGDPPFEEPLRRLLASMESEAKLNAMGRLASRFDVIRLLSNRLRIEEERKRHREIAETEVRRPIIITGLPRTGTTLLHKLLALDPANRVPLTWEVMNPSPPPETATYRTDPRIRLAGRQIQWFHRLVKDFNRIHPVGPCLPIECIVISSHSFLSYQFETTHTLPSYQKWLEAQDLRPACEVHRRVLQHLQYRCPGERWVLKAPAHMFDFDALFAVYPDACIVMTHRDPIEAAASNASLTATLRSAFSDAVDPLQVGPECSLRWAEAIRRALRFRERDGAPAERFLDVYYADLVADPLGAVRRVYAQFQVAWPLGLTERVQAFLRESPKDHFGRHRYSLEEFGLDLDEEKRRYAEYRERFRL